jgi:hypothetical protein
MCLLLCKLARLGDMLIPMNASLQRKRAKVSATKERCEFMYEGMEPLAQTVERVCAAAQARLMDLSDSEQRLQAQRQACMRAEVEAHSRQEVLKREEDDVTLYTREVMLRPAHVNCSIHAMRKWGDYLSHVVARMHPCRGF